LVFQETCHMHIEYRDICAKILFGIFLHSENIFFGGGSISSCPESNFRSITFKRLALELEWPRNNPFFSFLLIDVWVQNLLF
jgi:hypothetical protein